MSTLTEEGKNFILDIHDQLGVYLTPIEHGFKRPPLDMGWEQYYENRASRNTLEGWLQQYDAFAAICGQKQRCLGLDFDIPKDAEDQENLHPKSQGLYNHLFEEYPTWAQKSGAKCGSRRHLIYFSDESKPTLPIQNLLDYPGLQIRGEKCLLLVAYSRHPSGGYYELLRNPLEDGVGIFPYEFFGDKINLDFNSRSKKSREQREARAKSNTIYKISYPGRHEYLIQETGHYCRTTPRWKEVITALNQTHCDPPLPPYELDSIFVSGEKYSKDSNSGLEDDEEVIPEKLFTTLEELEKKDIPEPKFLVDGGIKIPENAITIIFGPTAQFKSFFLESLFIPWSKGENAFGTTEITTVKSRILLVPTEHSASLEKKRFKYLGGLGNPNIAIYDRADKFRIENEKEVTLLLSTLVKGEFDVGVVDVQSDIHSGDDSSAKDIIKLIRFYRKIIALGKTPIGVAHTKKGEIKNLIEAIRGSGDIGNKSACALCIRKTSKTSIVVESAKSRSSEPLAPIALEVLIKEGQVAGFKYIGETEAFGDKILEADKAEDTIMATMEDLKQAESELLHNLFRDPETREYTVVKKWAVKAALKNLVAKGILTFKAGSKGWGGVCTHTCRIETCMAVVG